MKPSAILPKPSVNPSVTVLAWKRPVSLPTPTKTPVETAVKTAVATVQALGGTPWVGFRVHELLERRRPAMSQAELSRRSGVSLTTINAVVNNATRRVDLDTLARIAGALGLEASQLLVTSRAGHSGQ